MNTFDITKLSDSYLKLYNANNTPSTIWAPPQQYNLSIIKSEGIRLLKTNKFLRIKNL